MYAEDRAAAAYGGLIHIYELTEEGEALETARADLADVFPEDAGKGSISLSTRIWGKDLFLFQPGYGFLKTALY